MVKQFSFGLAAPFQKARHQVLFDGEVLKDRAPLWAMAKAAFCDLIRLHPVDTFAFEADLPRGDRANAAN